MKTLRRVMEHSVIAHNKMLREVVSTMENIILLRNMHPLYRGDYAMLAYKNGIITAEQAREFTKIVSYGSR